MLGKAPADLRLVPRQINGEAALVALSGGEVLQTFHVNVDHHGRVRSLYVMRNPDKLTPVSI